MDVGRHITAGNVDSVARGFMERNERFLKIDEDELALRQAERDSPLYRHQSGVWYAAYEQVYRGVPVEDGFVVLVYVDDKLVTVNNNFLRGISLNPVPGISAEKAAGLAVQDAGVSITPLNTTLLVTAADSGYHLAWKVQLPLDERLGGAWAYYVDAHDGRLIRKFNNIVFGDIYGRVTGMIYPEHWKNSRSLVNFTNLTVRVYQPSNNSIIYSGKAHSLVSAAGTNRSINLSGYTDVNITFMARYELENNSDYSYARVSANGSSWQTLETFTGRQLGWILRNYSLNNYINRSVYINFTTSYDASVVEDGFFVDNVSIVANSGIVFSEDFNSTSNWSLAGYSHSNDTFINFTNTNYTGHYNITGFSGNATVITSFRSPWIRVVDRAATYDANHTAEVNSTLNGSHSWNWNGSDPSYSLELSNVFYHATRVHDYFTNGTPFNVSGLNYEMLILVQDTSLSSNCNAFYAPATGTVHFTPAGGGCNATSLGSDIVYHEYTHAAVDQIYSAAMTSGQPGAMNEALADYFAATLNGNPCLADEWDSTTPCLRNLNNSVQKPTSFTQVHADSQSFSGAMWELRLRVGNTKSDDLVIRAMKVQSQTFNAFLEDLLVMDDNNTNLSDGTPNRGQLCYSFSVLHGINSSLCNNSAPVLTTGPATQNVISWPINLTFSFNYTDEHNDLIAVSWFLNSSNQTAFFNSTSYNFTNATIGSYNVSVFVSDWNSSASYEWRLDVKTVPVWNFTLQNYTIQEDSSLSFNISASDFDNDTIRYYVNDSRFNLTGATVPQGVNVTLNFTPAANFNGLVFINLTAFDGVFNTSDKIFVNVTPVNDVLYWNFSPSNQSMLEDAALFFNISASDVDNDTIRYYLNDSRFNVTPAALAQGLNVTVNFTPASNFNGTVPLNITAWDGTANISEVILVNISPQNDPPEIAQQANMSVNETDWVNFTVSASDPDNGFFNYSVNDTRFAQNTSGNFSWRTNLASSGIFAVLVNVTDGNASSAMQVNITVFDQIDSDLDGVPDIYDSDDDNDGIPDSEDYLLGTNNSFINVTNMLAGSINISVNSSSNLSQRFNGTFFVNVSNSSVSILEFFWNFTNSTLNLNFTYEVQPAASTFGAVLVRGLALQYNLTKNVSLLAVNGTIGTVCVKDADVSSLYNISVSCNGQNETLISCPGQNSSYSCSLVNSTGNTTYFKVAGLRFSAARQQCPDSDADGYYASGCGNGTDCHDSSSGINPGATEVCGDGIDQNCDGVDLACSSGSSSGGGGGGGGGSTTPSQSAKVSHVFSGISAGRLNTMKVGSPQMPVSLVSFFTNRPVDALTLVAEPAADSPLAIESAFASHASYAYFRLSATPAIPDSDFASVSIDFRVNSSFAGRFGSVHLYRLVSGSWQQLPTSRTGGNQSFYYYSASSPGFSYFAIAGVARPSPEPEARLPSNGTAAVTEPEPLPAQVNETQAPEPAAPGKPQGISLTVLAVLLVAVLIAAGLFFLLQDRSQRKL